MIWLSGLGAFVTCIEFGFPHALAVEFDAVGIVDEAIEDNPLAFLIEHDTTPQ
jgi:hypothetical protein